MRFSIIFPTKKRLLNESESENENENEQRRYRVAFVYRNTASEIHHKYLIQNWNTGTRTRRFRLKSMLTVQKLFRFSIEKRRIADVLSVFCNTTIRT